MSKYNLLSCVFWDHRKEKIHKAIYICPYKRYYTYWIYFLFTANYLKFLILDLLILFFQIKNTEGKPEPTTPQKDWIDMNNKKKWGQTTTVVETVSNSTTALYEYEWLTIQPNIITIQNEKELNKETNTCTEIAYSFQFPNLYPFQVLNNHNCT